MTEMMTLLLMLSTIIWYLIDRFKGLWENLSWGKYITIAVSCLLSLAVVLTFRLDLVVALGATETVTVIGEVFAVLGLMGGSSAISELIGLAKKKTSD